jgi:hypothetical protein
MKIKIALLGLIIGFGLPMLITSCSQNLEDDIKNQTSGVMKVVKVESENPKLCSYKIEGDDITSTNGYFTIECECGKFNANDRLELRVIDEKKVELKQKFYFIDESGTVTIAKTNETDLIDYVKDLKDSKKVYQIEITKKDSLIYSYESKIDSLTKIINGK